MFWWKYQCKREYKWSIQERLPSSLVVFTCQKFGLTWLVSLLWVLQGPYQCIDLWALTKRLWQESASKLIPVGRIKFLMILRLRYHFFAVTSFLYTAYIPSRIFHVTPICNGRFSYSQALNLSNFPLLPPFMCISLLPSLLLLKIHVIRLGPPW